MPMNLRNALQIGSLSLELNPLFQTWGDSYLRTRILPNNLTILGLFKILPDIFLNKVQRDLWKDRQVPNLNMQLHPHLIDLFIEFVVSAIFLDPCQQVLIDSLYTTHQKV